MANRFVNRRLRRMSVVLAGVTVGAIASATVLHLADPWTHLQDRDVILVSETCATCRHLLRVVDGRRDLADEWVIVALDDPSSRTSRTLCDRVIEAVASEHPWFGWVPRTVGCRLLTRSARRYHGQHFAWVPAVRKDGRPLRADEQTDALPWLVAPATGTGPR